MNLLRLQSLKNFTTEAIAQTVQKLPSQLLLLTLSFLCLGTTPQFASTGLAQSTPQAISLNVFPDAVNLGGARDFQSLIGQSVDSNDITTDVTGELRIQPIDEKIVRVEEGIVYPVANGTTQLKVTLGKFTKTIPVTVKDVQSDPELSFQLDVMPVFSKTGCNAGSCHGAARGKDGFRLSLFGYDPKGDYFRLTREMPGRRIDVAVPEDCLLTNKATNRVAHTGGKLFDTDSPYYAVLKRWLEEGAVYDGEEVAEVTGIELFPPGGLLNGEGSAQQLNVLAQYSDGSTRDVTQLAYFSATNPDAASVSQDGRVIGGARGESFVMSRYGTHTVGSAFITLPRDLKFESDAKRYPENNFIDAHINAKLKKLRIYPSELCTDNEFIRRVSIDICGRLPTVEEVNLFLADEDAQKRSKLIDGLLEQDDFLDIWVMKWSELLQIRTSRTMYAKGAHLYFQWLQEKFYSDTPLNEVVVELMSASGSTFDNPPTNFYEVARDPLLTAENTAQVFLGMRIQCAQCHNHPFDRWTMEDYYSFASFFAKVRAKPTSDPRQVIISEGGGKEIKHPVSGAVMQPKFLGGAIRLT